MKKPRSIHYSGKRVSTERERKSSFRVVTIAAIIALVLVALFALFPGKARSASVSRDAGPDRLVKISSWPANVVARGLAVDEAGEPNAPAVTTFNEVQTAWRTSVFNIKPTWGVSVIRDTTTIGGTGAQVSESGGEIYIQTGTQSTGTVRLRTLSRGQYRAGTAAQTGIGLRIPTAPTGSQYAEWGYFDESNGFGFGVSSSCLYTFKLTSSVKTKTCQSQWNYDTLDGSASTSNPSGLGINISTGHVYQIDFVWYGYGSIVYSINAGRMDGVERERKVHVENVAGSVTIVDPNQPITVLVENGGTTASNFQVYVGGRQFSVIGGDSRTDRRLGYESIHAYAVPTAVGIWHPILAIRKKDLFGPSNRRNSVRTFASGIEVISNQEIQVMVTISTTHAVTGGTPAYGTPSDNISSETSIETKVQGGSMTGLAFGIPIFKAIVTGGTGAASSGRIAGDKEVFLGGNREIIVWIKRIGTAPTISAQLEWTELW